MRDYKGWRNFREIVKPEVQLLRTPSTRSSQNLPSETVWKFEMGPESGLRKRPEGIEGVPIGRLLPPKKRARDAFSYFPNSFSETV
jgi:hypothetical protein